MKNIFIILTFLLLSYTESQSIENKLKTTTADTAAISIDLPIIPIQNNYSKKAHVTSITINYKIPGENSIKTITTSTQTVIPQKRGKTFALKLSLPATSNTPQTATYHGVSEIKIFDDIIKFETPWTGLIASNTIFINNIANKWVLDKNAMNQSAKNKKSNNIQSSATNHTPTLTSKKPQAISHTTPKPKQSKIATAPSAPSQKKSISNKKTTPKKQQSTANNSMIAAMEHAATPEKK